jgi:hypothetical protein
MAAKLRILTALMVMIFSPLLWRGAGGEAQAQIIDNFSDGNFTSYPAWSGNDTDFTVNTSKQLQLNSSGTSISYLKISNTQSLKSCEWNFWVRLNFSPSSGNYARVYLCSDQPDLSSGLNGYYLQFGESLSNDQVELFRQSGTSSASVCRGTTLIASAFSIRVKVTRDSAGLWQLFTDPTGNTNYTQEASGTDNTFSSGAYFGVLCEYTSSNATGFYFDDFYIFAAPDTVPARIDSAEVISENKIDVYFSEDIDKVSAETVANYSADNGIGFAVSAKQDSLNSRLVHLTFGNYFSDGQYYTLTVTGVQDMAGNNTLNEKFQFLFIRPMPNDIVINEVLFDPFDGGVEWLEIYNRSDKTIDLKDLSLCSRDKTGLLSEINQIAPGGYMIAPQSYLVLSEDATAIKSQYHTENPNGFIEMNSIPSLNNDSDKIVLADAKQIIIDELHYNSSWHLPLLNDNKGFSLERVNYEAPAQSANNWHTASSASGGATPAYQNSQYLNGESGTEISVSPEVFSPDNDGHNDVLGISWNFDTPGMIGNIQIYDSGGRLEKTLVRNVLLATSGTYYWDGINDEKTKSRIGIYIIYFEAFDTKGGVKKYRKSFVLGGRL